MNMSRYMYLLVILCTYFSSVFTAGVQDVTNAVHLNKEGVIAGYGDFNSDKYTDIFIISDQWTTLYLYLWDGTKLHFHPGNKLLGVKSGPKIVSIALADFDGDGNMDILLSCKDSNHPNVVIVHVYHGNMKSVNEGTFIANMTDQPAVVEVNGDLLPDLFGYNSDTKMRSYWISVQSNRSFEPLLQFSSGISASLVIPSSNAFVDVTGDLHPDLFIKSFNNDRKEMMFETWEYIIESKKMTLKNNVVMNIPGVKHVGQVSFADIDGDSIIDMILPVCMTDDCSRSVIYRRRSFVGSMEWEILVSNDNQDWKFPAEMTDASTHFPVTLRFNDVTMDGMSDAVTILQQKKGDTKFAAFFENIKCFKDKYSGCNGSRALQVNHLFQGVDNPVLISLLDVYENGALDFMVTCKRSKLNFHTKVLRNDLNFDTAFLKVAVLSGAKKTAIYGSIQIGAMVDIKTTNTDGEIMRAQNAQLCQSAYFALQLPYVIFGLGKSPNFVEEISVGIAKGPKKVNRMKKWTAIIPNAQVIVIPYPKDNPYDWVTKLLVTPGKLLLQTAGVLIGTILVICGIILILHIKEKKEDEREKRKEAHKFHFDAL